MMSSRLMLAACLCLPNPPTQAQPNLEVGRRVLERINDTMTLPPTILRQMSAYRSSGAFPNDLRAADRDAFFRYDASLTFVHRQLGSIYFGLEDGTFSAVNLVNAAYREPGESGYVADDEGWAGNMQKHYLSCVDMSGRPIPCLLQSGESYIECLDGCALTKCPDASSQRDCLALTDDTEILECKQNIRWCKSYRVAQVPEDAQNMGFVPLSPCCIDPSGALSQTPGHIHDGQRFDEQQVQRAKMGQLANCYFRDGVTPVQRNLAGDYAYCGGNGAVCNDTFVGCYFSLNFDPRFRPWYMATKDVQAPTWIPPYVLFSSVNELGITFTHPIYELQEGRKNIFAGVLAVDLSLLDLTTFLTRNYNRTETIVAIIEERTPNYIIATSTGSVVAKSVMADDNQMPCNGDITAGCVITRITINDLKMRKKDALIFNAFQRQAEAGFPDTELIIVRDGRDAYYASQTLPFLSQDNVLDWRIVILSPVQARDTDTVNLKDPLISSLVAISLVGFAICLSLFLLVIIHRKKREIAFTDWRFTGVFILGCALCNLACLSMIAPVSDSICLLQMWLLHFLFVFSLAPLFAKIYRVYKLVGSDQIRRITITHFMTVLIASPIVILEVILLTIFTFVDPNHKVEIIEQDGPDVIYRFTCSRHTKAFFIVMALYEGCLVLVGCVLAYKTRHLKREFLEARPLIIAMYTISLMASFLATILSLSDIDQEAKNLFIALGIALGTCISSSAFVVPRMFRIFFSQRNNS